MTTVDLIILIVIAVYALIGLYRGLIRTVFHFLGGIVAFIGACLLSSQFSAVVSEWLAPTVGKMVTAALPSLTGTEETTQLSGEQLWQSLSGYTQSLLTTSGTSADTITESTSPLDALKQAVTGEAAQAIAYVLIFIVSFVVLSIVLNIAASALDLVAHLPVLHAFNHGLGCALGAVMGLLLCTCVLWALKVFAPAVYSDVGLLPPETMEESVIARELVGWNGGVSLFETPTDA